MRIIVRLSSPKRGSIERHIEEEPQCRDGAVDLWRSRAARCQMQLVAAHILPARSVGRASKKRSERLHVADVALLGLRR